MNGTSLILTEDDGMSLIRQLWLAIALLMVIGFGGSFLVSSLSAKNYLEEQLALKNLDNANSLASVLGQMSKDPVEIGLLVSSQFDLGNYEYIRLSDPRGGVISEQRSDNQDLGAPGWFRRMLHIDVAPGVAQVQDGWKQYGTLELASHTRFAYTSLWAGSLRLLGWFLGASLLAGLAGTFLLRVILRPLDDVVTQAEAIGARRFITTREPGTREFQAVVRSMNTLAKRVRQMLEEESLRLDTLRREAHYDRVSSLLNRGHFIARLQAVLERDDESANGVVVIARLLDLNELNRSQGWAVIDTFIKRFADALRAMSPEGAEWVLGRLNGSDFAVLAPVGDDALALARRVHDSMLMLARELKLEEVCRMPTAATAYRFDEKLGAVLARVDAALASACAENADPVQIATGDQSGVLGALKAADLATWGRQLDEALASGWVKLQSYPVIDAKGALLHAECVARLRLRPDGDWLAAGEFMPWVSRLGYGPRLDEIVIGLALERMRHGADALCVNLSAQAMNDPMLLHRIAARLVAEPQLSQRLWLEVPEHGVFQHLEQFRILCALLKPAGCKLGIEHVGHQVSRIGQLHDLGLDYMKIDASFVNDLEQNPSNQVFLRGLAIIAHSIGLSAIGEGARSEAEIASLLELGFDGVTGPAVTQRPEQTG
jgi:EAL domain-containing protein (putative c-di-GMP-specific phosphodiesterase class I)/GGDEF domain-containing protein